MGDLRRGQCPFLLKEPRQTLVAVDLAVVPQAEIALSHAPARLDGAVLGEDDAELAERKLAKVHQMVVVHHAIRGTVLNHGRDDGTVGCCDATHLEGCEQQRLGQTQLPL